MFPRLSLLFFPSSSERIQNLKGSWFAHLLLRLAYIYISRALTEPGLFCANAQTADVCSAHPSGLHTACSVCCFIVSPPPREVTCLLPVPRPLCGFLLLPSRSIFPVPIFTCANRYAPLHRNQPLRSRGTFFRDCCVFLFLQERRVRYFCPDTQRRLYFAPDITRKMGCKMGAARIPRGGFWIRLRPEHLFSFIQDLITREGGH